MNAFVVILLALGAVSPMPLAFERGKRYTYNYQTDVYHAIPGGSTKTLGLRARCQAHVDVLEKTELQLRLANIQVAQVEGNLQDPKQQKETEADPKIVAKMQGFLALPVKLAFKAQDGSIKQVYADPKDQEWSLNIKRGLANLFQMSPRQQYKSQGKNGKRFVTQFETTAVGDCQVSYVIQCDNCQAGQKEQVTKVTKVISYQKCRHRPEFSQSNFYGRWCEKCQQSVGNVPYHQSAGQIEYTLSGNERYGYTIKWAEAVEKHVVTPLSQAGGQLTASARQCLEFHGTSDAGQPSKTLARTTTHRFVAENPERRDRNNTQCQQETSRQAQNASDEMCKAINQTDGQRAAEMFANLVQQLRKCNQETAMKLADNMLSRRDASERKYCIDALSFVGTREAFQVLKKKIQERKINKAEELKRVFLGLAFAPRPTADHIDAAWELCEHAEVKRDISARRQCMLTLGALVRKIRQRPSLQQDTKAKAACNECTQKILDRLAGKTTEQERVMYIKAIGNSASPQAQPVLQKILRDRDESLYIRVECVWAHRHIIRQARQTATPSLISIFADARESPELRMAVFIMLLNSEPNFATLQALANIVKREITCAAPGPRSNQVASFVLSHLAALAYQNNVLTKHRCMQARLALRLMPKMSYGPGYSKGMRWAQYSEKFQAGFEFEANRMDVPDSTLPRNLNAQIRMHVLGYQMSALEFGARIENMDYVIEQVISEVRKRHKRSLWGAINSFFNKESSEDETSKEVKSEDGESEGTPKIIRPATRHDQENRQRMSAYLKLFGDEVKYMEIRQEDIKQFSQDVADLMLGKKDRIENADRTIVITPKGIEIKQAFEKAFMANNARRVVPTLAGIPLDFQHRTAAVAKVTVAAKINVEPSIATLLLLQKLTAITEIKPVIGAHEQAQVGIHTPFLRMGVRVKAAAHSNTEHKADANYAAGQEFSITYNVPQQQRNILNMQSDAHGFVAEKDPKTCQEEEKQLRFDFKTPHLKQVQVPCKGEDLFGVQICAEGWVPDLPTLRLQQVPVFPAVALTKLRVSMAPAADKPTAVHCRGQVTQKSEKEWQVEGSINASSQTARRRIPYRMTVDKAAYQMAIQVGDIQAEGYDGGMARMTARYGEMKLEFGRGKLQYQVSASGQVQDQGKTARLMLQWTKVPEQWVTFFYNWEPQIWYFLQQFAWIRRPEQSQNQVQIEFALTSPLTARLKMRTPDAIVERTGLNLPLRVDHFPSSLQEIKNYFYAKCEVQKDNIKVFDQLQYEHNIKGGCPYTLAKEQRKDKQSRIQVSVQIDEQGLKTLIVSIRHSFQQQAQESVRCVVKPDGTTLIDGKRADCSQKACKSKLGGVSVHKAQRADGKTQVQLSTKMGLHATMDQDQRIDLYASPFLRSRVCGLCGDADGEEWNEYRDPKDKVQQLDQFIKSWQEKC